MASTLIGNQRMVDALMAARVRPVSAAPMLAAPVAAGGYVPPAVLLRLLDPRHLTDALNKEPSGDGMMLPVNALLSMQGYDPLTNIAAGIQLVYTGDTLATVTVRHYHLITSTAAGFNLSLDLSVIPTLSALVAQINATTGYSAQLDAGADPNASPLRLIEMDRQNIGTQALRMFVSTSVLWSIMKAVAWAIEDSYVNLVNGLLELEPATADGRWVDVWGSTYGNVIRNAGESDNVYSTRIIKEVVRQRLTVAALELILPQDLGFPAGSVTVSGNLYPLVFVVGQTKVGSKILCDRIHCRTVFFVNIDQAVTEAMTPAQCQAFPAILNRNRMAGTLPVTPWLPYVVWPAGSYVVYGGYIFHAAADAPAGLSPIFDSVGEANKWGVSINFGDLTNIAPLVPYPWFILTPLPVGPITPPGPPGLQFTAPVISTASVSMTVTTAPIPYNTVVLNDGPAAFWPLDDGAGSSSTRELVGNVTGTPTNITFGAAGATSDGATAASFDGATSQITIPNLWGGNQFPLLPITVEFFVKGSTTSPIGIFDTFPSSAGMRNYPAGQYGYVSYATYNLGLPDTNWHHVAFVMYYTTQRMLDYYLDGVLVRSTSDTSGNNYTGFGTPGMLGNINTGGAGWFAGSLAKVAIYNKQLTATQIANHYARR